MKFDQLVSELGIKLAVLLQGDSIDESVLRSLSFDQALEAWLEAPRDSLLEKGLYRSMEEKAQGHEDIRRMFMICPKRDRMFYWNAAVATAPTFENMFSLWMILEEDSVYKMEAWSRASLLAKDFLQKLRMWKSAPLKSVEKRETWKLMMDEHLSIDELQYLLCFVQGDDKKIVLEKMNILLG